MRQLIIDYLVNSCGFSVQELEQMTDEKLLEVYTFECQWYE